MRRAGLKPGLERSFGCEPQLTGLVVAQEPEPGAELARNGLVMLYVAAPGAVRETVPAAELAVLEQSEEGQPTRALADAEAASQSDTPRRRRKPGRLESAPVLDIAPAPRLPGERIGARRPVPAPADHGAIVEDEHLDELGDATEEYVIAADALFVRGFNRAGHRSMGTPIAWLSQRLRRSPRLLRAALVLLALWLLVAAGAALLAHGSRQVPQPRPPASRAEVPIAAARPPRTAPHPPSEPRRRAPRPARHLARPSRSPHQEAHTATKQAPGGSAPSSPSAVTQPAASSSPTPAPRHEGGPFSP